MTVKTGAPSLPVVNIAPHHPLTRDAYSDADRAAVARQLHEACRDVGFFYLRVDSILPQEEMDRVLQLGHEFFHRPQEEKDAIHLEHGDGARGYQRLNQNITLGKADHHEGLDLYAPSPFSAGKTGPLTGENQWPAQPAALRPAMEDWIAKMTALGAVVMRAMAAGLGMNAAEADALVALCERSFWVMRVIGYPPLPAGADGKSCGEHKDYGCLTFLHADSTPNALQVLSRENTWLAADPIPGTVVVNIGDMWELWTGGLYPATLHRVMHRSPTYRVSIPFFYEPNFDAPVAVLDAARRTAAAEGRTMRDMEGVVYGDHLLGKVSGNFRY